MARGFRSAALPGLLVITSRAEALRHDAWVHGRSGGGPVFERSPSRAAGDHEQGLKPCATTRGSTAGRMARGFRSAALPGLLVIASRAEALRYDAWVTGRSDGARIS